MNGKWGKRAFLGTEEFKGFSSNMHKFQEIEPFICMESCSKETPCLMCNVHGGIESSNKAKISLIGVRRQKNGRYGAVITIKLGISKYG
uniref:Putative ovule protein n=1 Tax=Solanum chacoense TaxID=4108 RepID=A0A0V0GUF3_SOLCH